MVDARSPLNSSKVISRNMAHLEPPGCVVCYATVDCSGSVVLPIEVEVHLLVPHDL